MVIKDILVTIQPMAHATVVPNNIHSNFITSFYLTYPDFVYMFVLISLTISLSTPILKVQAVAAAE